MADFDWQLDELFKVLGGSFPQHMLNNKFIADVLDVSASGISQRRNGSTVLRGSEANAILMAYNLNQFQLDESLFEIDDPVAFRRELSDRGVGIHGDNPLITLFQKLTAAQDTHGLPIEIIKARPQRGIGFPTDAAPKPRSLYVGEQVRIKVRGRKGRHIAVLQQKRDAWMTIDILSPSEPFPETEIEDTPAGANTFLLPRSSSEALPIMPPTGSYTLVVVEGDQELIDCFYPSESDVLADDMNIQTKALRLHNADARVILDWLKQHPSATFRTNTLEFLVLSG
ncbi:MAG: hypothetical protein ACRBBT_05940 [Paracoccaceae bacterium]